MNKIIAMLFLLLLCSCGKDAERTERVNENFDVETLFTHEGCTVYRFNDGLQKRYFTNCKGQTFWQENCGKSCSREVSIPTNKE